MGGNIITNNDIKTIEFSFGDVRKYYPKDVTFDNSYFIVSLSQKDTFSLSTRKVCNYQARVLFNDGSVKGTTPTEFSVIASESKEVLS
jgi:hypothetical protein